MARGTYQPAINAPHGQHPLTPQQIHTYQHDGIVLIPGLFKDHVDTLCRGINYNMANPGPYAAENLQPDEAGRFFDDYCNGQRNAEFESVIRQSALGEVAATLMQSSTATLFHDHVLVKEPGTSTPTPWHQDSPYYLVDGEQTISFWSPMDPVTDASLRCVAGSHPCEKPVLPTSWLAEDSLYVDSFYVETIDGLKLDK